MDLYAIVPLTHTMTSRVKVVNHRRYTEEEISASNKKFDEVFIDRIFNGNSILLYSDFKKLIFSNFYIGTDNQRIMSDYYTTSKSETRLFRNDCNQYNYYLSNFNSYHNKLTLAISRLNIRLCFIKISNVKRNLLNEEGYFKRITNITDVYTFKLFNKKQKEEKFKSFKISYKIIDIESNENLNILRKLIKNTFRLGESINKNFKWHLDRDNNREYYVHEPTGKIVSIFDIEHMMRQEIYESFNKNLCDEFFNMMIEIEKYLNDNKNSMKYFYEPKTYSNWSSNFGLNYSI